MHNCSKELTVKFSNPNMSKTPKNLDESCPGFVQVFIWFINQANVLEYNAFAIACRFSPAWKFCIISICI